MFQMEGRGPQVVMAEVGIFPLVLLQRDVVAVLDRGLGPVRQQLAEPRGGEGSAPMEMLQVARGGDAQDIGEGPGLQVEGLLLAIEGDHGSWILTVKTRNYGAFQGRVGLTHPSKNPIISA